MATRSMASITRQAPKANSDVIDWRDKAVCKDWDFKKNGDPFYPTSNAAAQAHRAQSICAACPVRYICRDSAHEDASTFKYGIFGGTTPEDRAKAARKRAAENTRRPRK